jgi:hypothetical protein
MFDVAPDGRLLMGHTVVSVALFYLPALASKETDLYWHDSSQICDISKDNKFVLFSEGGDATRSGEDFPDITVALKWVSRTIDATRTGTTEKS